MQKKEMPHYYAVITADVRYDERLSSTEKLLCGEISALCNKEGYCWARNAFFADLYKVDPATISRMLSNLETCGFIKIEKSQSPYRRILLRQKDQSNFDEKVKVEDPLLSNNIINKEPQTPPPLLYLEFGKEFKLVRLTKEEAEKLITRLGQAQAQEYVNRLDGYLKSKGVKYKSHYATILNWVRRDGEQGRYK